MKAQERLQVWFLSAGMCGICGQPVSFDEMHVDHIVPRSLNGPDHLSNYRAAHKACNEARGNAHEGNPRFVRASNQIRSHLGSATISGSVYLSLKQAAERLGVAYSTLRRQAKIGALRATMIADSYVVTPEEVERYRRENKGKTGPKPRKKDGAE